MSTTAARVRLVMARLHESLQTFEARCWGQVTS